MNPVSILFCFHFIFDFLLQSREMGQKKSKNYVFLFAHIFIVSIGILIGGLLVFKDFGIAVEFSFWNGFWHLIIDAIMWNAYALSAFVRFYNGKDGIPRKNPFDSSKEDWAHLMTEWQDVWPKDHWFFATIGLDQLLHFITINELYPLFEVLK